MTAELDAGRSIEVGYGGTSDGSKSDPVVGPDRAWDSVSIGD